MNLFVTYELQTSMIKKKKENKNKRRWLSTSLKISTPEVRFEMGEHKNSQQWRKYEPEMKPHIKSARRNLKWKLAQGAKALKKLYSETKPGTLDILWCSPKSNYSFHCRRCISWARVSVACSWPVRATRAHRRSKTPSCICTSPGAPPNASLSQRAHNPLQDTSVAADYTTTSVICNNVIFDEQFRRRRFFNYHYAKISHRI